MADINNTPEATIVPTDSTVVPTVSASDLIGIADGAIENGEKIVYEYNQAGDLLAWHKEQATLAEQVGQNG